MGRLELKLAVAGLRRRRAQGLLTVVVVAVSAGALTIAFAIGSVADRPFDRTFEATNGAHVTVESFTTGNTLAPLAQLPSVVASTGVRPVVFSGFELAGQRYGLRLVGIDATRPEVERPILSAGTWPRNGEVLLERSFADFHHLGLGSELSMRRARVTVSGIAIVAAGEGYPHRQPGIAFGIPETLARIEPDRSAWRQSIGLRIADPERAPEVADAVRRSAGPSVGVSTWLDERADATAGLATVTVILSLFATILLVATGAVLATVVGGRVLAQSREIGVLKATGLTPGQVARLLVLEQMGLAVVGVTIGIAAGIACTPLFTGRSASLLAAPETPPFDAGRSLVVAVIVLALVAVFTGLPGLRLARRPTAVALLGGRRPGGSSSRLGRIADDFHAPIAVSVGARGVFAHRGRAMLTALSLSLTVCALVATLGMEASLEVATNPGVAPLVQGTDTPQFDPVDDDSGEAGRLRPIVYGFDAVLLFVGLVNLSATLLLTTRERIRDLGMLKAVGLTPRQVSASLVSEQLALALLAGLAGIPLGLALFRLGIGLAGSSDEFAYPSWWTLLLLVPGVMLLVAALATPFARRAAAMPVADALRFE